MIDDLEIGGADRNRVDAHEHLGLLRHRYRLLLQSELAGIAEHPGLHGVGDRIVLAGLHSGGCVHQALLHGRIAVGTGLLLRRRVDSNRCRRLVYKLPLFEGQNCRKPVPQSEAAEQKTEEMPDHSISMVSIGDCRIRLMRGGAGAPLVFLHGGGGLGIWLPCMARLAKKFDVIAPEHPGFGESDTPAWLDTIGDLANFYLDFLDQLDLDGVHLVGSSLGGWIAADLAVRNSTRLASLTLVGSAGIHVSDVEQVDPFLRTEQQRIRDLFYDQELAEAVVASMERPEMEDAALKNRMTTAKLAWQPRNHDPQLRKWLHRIKVPTLLIWGAEDRLFPRPYAIAFQQLIPGSTAVILPECGHLPHVEKGDAFAAELEGFIDNMRAAA